MGIQRPYDTVTRPNVTEVVRAYLLDDSAVADGYTGGIAEAFDATVTFPALRIDRLGGGAPLFDNADLQFSSFHNSLDADPNGGHYGAERLMAEVRRALASASNWELADVGVLVGCRETLGPLIADDNTRSPSAPMVVCRWRCVVRPPRAA